MKLLPLALALLNDTAQTRLTGMTKRATALAAVGVLATVSAVFLLVALTILLAAEIGIVPACLAMSGLFALAALVVFWRSGRRRARRRAARVEKAALASSAGTSTGATGLLLARAFLKGFLRRGP